MNKINWYEMYEKVCRLYVFFFLNFYGIGKILGGQFYRKGEWPQDVAIKTIEQASAYELAWSFMGYSFAYILFIGVSQITGAWLLLWNRTKLLGVLILFPIMVNIVVFDIIFLDIKDALVNAIIYLSMLVYILYYNRKTIVEVLKSLTNPELNIKIDKLQQFKLIGITVLMIIVVFGIDQFLVNVVRQYSI